LAEVEGYVDVGIMYFIIITLAAIALAILLPELFPK